MLTIYDHPAGKPVTVGLEVTDTVMDVLVLVLVAVPVVEDELVTVPFKT